MKRWPINFRRVAIVAGLFVLVLLVMDFNARLEGLDRLNKEAKAVHAQATAVLQTQIALQTVVAYATSDQAVKDWARNEAHYIQPGDQLVMPLPDPNSTPLTSTEITPTPTPLQNWQVWWELFFGD